MVAAAGRVATRFGTSVADLIIGLPNGAKAAVVSARPARLVQPLTGDAGSVVRAPASPMASARSAAADR
jgi:hypothetical protein